MYTISIYKLALCSFCKDASSITNNYDLSYRSYFSTGSQKYITGNEYKKDCPDPSTIFSEYPILIPLF